MMGKMRRRLIVAFAFGVVALAISVGARQGQTVPPPKVVPPIVAPTFPNIPGTVTTNPRATGLATRSPLTAIIGQVVDTSGRPVPKAIVRLIANEVVETVLTDPRGRFAFTQIPQGEMIVTAQKFGYFDGAFGQRRATGLPLPFSLQYGQVMPSMRVEIYRGSTITGSVRDEAGEPIVGANVLASRRQFTQGEWQYIGVDAEETDDRGDFRIFDLLPGDYVVTVGSVPIAPPKEGAAQPQDRDRPTVFSRLFYPQAHDRLLALPVLLTPGEVRYGVNFTLPPINTRRVTGRLTGPGTAVADQQVRLVPFDASWATDVTAETQSGADGTFVFEDVPEGRYRLQAGHVSPRPWIASGDKPLADAINAARQFCGTAEVTVRGGDVEVPDVTMVQSAAIAGELKLVRVAGGVSSMGPRRVPFSIEPAAPGLSRAIQILVTPGVAFAVSNLIPGPYFVRAGAIPSGWVLNSIDVAGHDTIDFPVDLKDADAIVDITLANRGTELIGTVRDNRMQAAQGAVVIVMPVGLTRQNWSPNRIRETRTSASGVFSVRGLPPGEYMVVVVDEASAEGWQDERVLSRLTPLATRFTLKSMETQSLVLQMK